MGRIIPLILIFAILIYWFKLRNDHERGTVQVLAKMVCENDLIERTRKTLEDMDADQDQRVARAKGLSIDFEKQKISWHIFTRLTNEIKREEPLIIKSLDPMAYDTTGYHRKVALKVARKAEFDCTDKFTNDEGSQDLILQFMEHYFKTYR